VQNAEAPSSIVFRVCRVAARERRDSPARRVLIECGVESASMSPEVFQVYLPSQTMVQYRDAAYAVSSLCIVIAGAGVVLLKTLAAKRASAPTALDDDRPHEDEVPSSPHARRKAHRPCRSSEP
jgi:hypothetical protein